MPIYVRFVECWVGRIQRSEHAGNTTGTEDGIPGASFETLCRLLIIITQPDPWVPATPQSFKRSDLSACFLSSPKRVPPETRRSTTAESAVGRLYSLFPTRYAFAIPHLQWTHQRDYAAREAFCEHASTASTPAFLISWRALLNRSVHATYRIVNIKIWIGRTLAQVRRDWSSKK